MTQHHPRADIGALPRFSCHKVVRAARVTGIRRDEADGHTTTLEFGDMGLEWPVTHDFVKRHDPHVGGFFVVYDDGHQSFSPARAFLAGYEALPR